MVKDLKSFLIAVFWFVVIIGLLGFIVWVRGWSDEYHFNRAVECKSQGYEWSHYTRTCLNFKAPN